MATYTKTWYVIFIWVVYFALAGFLGYSTYAGWNGDGNNDWRYTTYAVGAFEVILLVWGVIYTRSFAKKRKSGNR